MRANTEAVESSPIFYAAQAFYPGGIEVEGGAIPNLLGLSIPGPFDSGHADLATHAEFQALRYSLDHPEVRILMTVSEGLYRIVARRSAGIESVGDLKGKRIAANAQTTAGYFLHRMLEEVGLSYDDVIIVPMNKTEMADAIAGGLVDAVSIWDPYSGASVEALQGDSITFAGTGVYREMFNINSTAEYLADPEKRAGIVLMVRAIIDASRAMQDDPSRAKTIASEMTHFTPHEIERTWPHLRFPATLPEDLLDVMKDEENWLAQQAGRRPRTRAQLASLIDRSILDEANALPSLPEAPRH